MCARFLGGDSLVALLDTGAETSLGTERMVALRAAVWTEPSVNGAKEGTLWPTQRLCVLSPYLLHGYSYVAASPDDAGMTLPRRLGK